MADYYPYLPPPTPIQGPVQTGLQVNALRNAQLDYNTKSALAPLDIATAQLNYDQANALAPLTIQAKQQALTAGDISNTSAQEELDTKTALDPYKITAAQRGDVAGQQQSDTETQNYYRSLRVDAANSALEAGDDDAAAAKIWDAKMQAAADKGDPTAAQYIGHYTQKLAGQMKNPVAGEPAGSQPILGFDDQAYIRSIATTDPAHLQAANEKLNGAITAFNRINSPQDLRDEVQTLKSDPVLGPIVSKQLAGLDLNSTDPKVWTLNMAAVGKQIGIATRMRDINNGQIASTQYGLPRQAQPTLYQPGATQRLGYTADKRPVLSTIDPITGKPVITYGPPGVNPVPSAGMQTLDGKIAFLRSSGVPDSQIADYLSGKRQMSPQQIQTNAQTLADREYTDRFVLGTEQAPPEGATAWITNRAKEFASTISGPPAAGRPGAPPANAPGSSAQNAIPAPNRIPQGQRVKNTWYATPRGPLKWTGTNWAKK